MKHYAKKALSLLLSAGTILLSVPFINAHAAQEMWLEGEQNGFKYKIQLNYGYVEITGYDADKTGVVEIPAEISGNPVTTIGYAAFRGCGTVNTSSDYTHGYSGCGITEIIIPDSVTTIKDCAFENCENLVKIHFPSGLKDFYGTEDGRFSGSCIGYASWIKGCSNLKEYTISSDNPYYKSVDGIIYSKDGKTLGPVPLAVSYDSIDLDGISSIGDFAFSSHSDMKGDIEIPSHITSLGNYAFYGCGADFYSDYEAPINILLNEGLTSIGEYSLANIGFLKEIDLPDSLVSLGKGALAEDRSIETVVVPPNVTVIPDSFLEDCYNIESVELPEGITDIGDYAFHGFIKMNSIKLPSTLETIGKGAFMPLSAFEDDEGLFYISIPDSVEYIGEKAFAYNKNLGGVKLSKNTKKIEPDTFTECGIISLVIPEGVTEICERAFQQNSLVSLKLPDTLVKIGPAAFKNGFVYDEMEGNKSVIIPDSVTEIGAGAFSGCFLSDIKLSSNLKSCGFLVVSGCNLSSLEIPEGVETLIGPTVMDTDKTTRIYLPKSLKELSPIAIAKSGYGTLTNNSAPYEIDSYQFYGESIIDEIYFAGTEQQWNALTKNWNLEEYYSDSSVMDNVKIYFNASVGSNIMGDANADGIFNIADIVMMRNYMLGQGRLLCTEAADLNSDGKVDIFDFCLMRRTLLANGN